MNAYLDITLRSVAVYFIMIIALGIFGKKEPSQLNTTDVMLTLLISNSVQNALVGANTSLYGGIIAAFSLFLINYIFKKVMLKSKFIKELVQDKPEILIHNGKIEFKTIARLGITAEELEEAMREHGIEYYKQVKLAMCEIDANIILLKNSKISKKCTSTHLSKFL